MLSLSLSPLLGSNFFINYYITIDFFPLGGREGTPVPRQLFRRVEIPPVAIKVKRVLFVFHP